MTIYRLYVDEVGNDDVGHVEDERHRYLSLSGVAMDQDYARDHATPALNTLKAILKHDPDRQVILHRKDIMNKRGVFGCLSDAAICAAFDAGMEKFLTEMQYTVITVVIDKLMMLKQEHWTEKHPYHYLMKILVEKYAQWLERKRSVGDIMPEMRRGKKDAALQRAFNSVRIWGSDYVNAKRIKAAIPAQQLKFRSKEHNITGLQICDLIAHPSHVDVRQVEGHDIQPGPFGRRIIPILTGQKYDRSPWNGIIRGYGRKYLP
ncbi:MAG: DUF3800 domain-containing protein [Xanthobacteraceae bacterium]